MYFFMQIQEPICSPLILGHQRAPRGLQSNSPFSRGVKEKNVFYSMSLQSLKVSKVRQIILYKELVLQSLNQHQVSLSIF